MGLGFCLEAMQSPPQHPHRKDRRTYSQGCVSFRGYTGCCISGVRVLKVTTLQELRPRLKLRHGRQHL